MAATRTMNISLTPELEKLVQDRVASGLYSSASEVVRDGLRLLQERDHARQLQFADLKARIEEGLIAADRGDVVSSKKALAELRQRSKEHRARGR